MSFLDRQPDVNRSTSALACGSKWFCRAIFLKRDVAKSASRMWCALMTDRVLVYYFSSNSLS